MHKLRCAIGQDEGCIHGLDVDSAEPAPRLIEENQSMDLSKEEGRVSRIDCRQECSAGHLKPSHLSSR